MNWSRSLQSKRLISFYFLLSLLPKRKEQEKSVANSKVKRKQGQNSRKQLREDKTSPSTKRREWTCNANQTKSNGYLLFQ